ncbi:immunoglobulin lambda-1 light chain-like [Solea senegalensis]|nr:immunoglobulin lambda-1 light chain-like [Solea senegalensis]
MKNKMITVFCITLNIMLISGSSLSDKVKQTPAHMIKKSTETANISCSHSIDSYNQILWYKQLNNRQLQLLGYMLANIGKPETGADVKIHGSANKDQNCTLTIETLDLNSSAVYFCAASLHSATHHCSSVQKPHHHYVFISS